MRVSGSSADHQLFAAGAVFGPDSSSDDSDVLPTSRILPSRFMGFYRDVDGQKLRFSGGDQNIDGRRP
jgi:hypothetical protein